MKRSALPIVLSLLCSFFFSYAGNAIGSMPNEKPTRKIQPRDGEKFYDPSTILVKFKEGVTTKQRKDFASLVRGKFKDKNEDGIDDRYERILGGRLALIELKGEKGLDLSSQALPALQNHPFVEYAERNYLYSIALTPNDQLFYELWGLHNTGQIGGTADADIDAPEAWEISTGSSEVIVGVIDTGVDYNHEDLAANMWINPNEIPNNGMDDDGNGYVDDIHGINTITGSGDPMDDHYHGTHCSGTIGAVGDNSNGVAGVNWAVKIIGIKFLNFDARGTTANAVESINYAVALKTNGVNIRVLSNSWGGASFSFSLLDAINAANDVGILFVAAAGNNSSNNDQSPYYPASYDSPNVIAVASTDHNDYLSYFSNYGPNSVDLGAPGSSVLSTFPNNSYSFLSGTSMATPHVSGAAALLLSVDDTLTVRELKNYLMDYGDAIPALMGLCVSGKRLNAYNSLSQLMPPEQQVAMTSPVITGDLNGDGSADIAGIDTAGKVWYTTDLSTWQDIPGRTLAKIATGDLNGDGNDDIVGVDASGSIWYRANLNTWISIKGKLADLVTGNFDGDGDDDIAGVNATGKVWYTNNLGNTWTQIPGRILAKIATGDLNGDSNLDIVGVDGSGKISYTTNLSSWVSIPGILVKIVTGDLDGDGDDDIAGLNSLGKLWYTTNLSSWTNIRGILEEIATGNLDGDSDDDIAGVNAIGRVWYTTNLGSTWTQISGQTLETIATGDLNGNGNDDIAGVDAPGKVWYSTNLSTWINIPLP